LEDAGFNSLGVLLVVRRVEAFGGEEAWEGGECKELGGGFELVVEGEAWRSSKGQWGGSFSGGSGGGGDGGGGKGTLGDLLNRLFGNLLLGF